MKKTMTLDEYRNRVKEIIKLSFEEFKKNDIDSAYEVILKFRDDDDLIAYGTFSTVLRKFDSVEKYIGNILKYLTDDDDIEPIENRAYWSVTRFVIRNDEYEEDITCCFSVNMELLSVNLDAISRNNFINKDCSKQAVDINNYHYLLTEPKNVDAPYKIGEILIINAIPFVKNFYVIYGGDGTNGEQQEYSNNGDTHCHWCIYESEDRNGLWIDNISSKYFTDYAIFECCPLNLCDKVELCTNKKIQKASKILKSNSMLWYKLLEIKEKKSNQIVNLDTCIFE